MTSYDKMTKGFSSSFIVTKVRDFSKTRGMGIFKNATRFIAKSYERSVFLSAIRGLSYGVLTSQINTFGLFFFSYGFYAALIYLLKNYTFSVESANPYSLFLGIIVMFLGLIMFFSKKNVARALYESRAMRLILFDFLGLRILTVAEAANNEVKKSFNVPFILGMVFGVISIFVEPIYVMATLAVLVLAAIVLSSPEAGIILIFLALPFLETMHLAAVLCLILVSYVLKLICGRRILRFHLVDFSVLAFLAFVFFGGVYTVDDSSFRKMLVFICFMLSYFVVRNLISSPPFVRRCLYALTISATLVSIYGLYQNFFGSLSTTWQDTAVFSEIKGRVVSTFANPNVLGEYIILIFPIILALMASAKRANERFALLIAAALNCACLVFTWSRGAWLGFAVSIVLFLCVSSKYFFTAGLLSIPVLGTAIYFGMDSSIIRRITSFGDSSTSYRLGIWEGVLRMLQDVGFYGIGIGEGAFARIYPAYALSGIETAPHSHNLYLQITVETGIFSLLAFLCFIFTFAQCTFSFCKNAMNRTNKSICLGIFCGILAFLIQGMTDYVWYNYRIFLLFWMLAGLGVAHVYASKNTDEESEHFYF